MLRIHFEEHPPDVLSLRLEGKLQGPWVGELLQAWSNLDKTRPPQASVRIDLNAVSFVDEPGRVLLAALHGRGCQLAGVGTFIAAVIDECQSTQVLGPLGKR